MSAALNIPEGFESTTPSSNLVFQNPTNWIKADAEGVMVQGIYKGLSDVDNFGKQNFIFEATADGLAFDKEGGERIFTAGATVIINTSSNLVSKLAKAEEGTELVVVYQGQNKLTKGPFKGKMAHSYNVLKRK